MPLNLPDKLPAIDLLKEENIFVIDNSSHDGNRLDSSVVQLPATDRGEFHEAEESYLQEYAHRTHEGVLL